MTSTVERAIKKATSLQETGQILQAQEIYTEFLAQYPASQKLINAQKMLKLGLSRKDMKWAQPSEALIDKLIRMYEDKQHSDVVGHTKWLLSFFPKSSILFNLLGAASRGLLDFEESINSFRNAIRLSPTDAETHNNLAISLKDAGYLSEAIKSYKQAINIKPNFFAAYVNLTYALKDSGDHEAAVGSITKALELKPEDEKATFLLATLTGSTLQKPPNEYVENLFDKFATTFDQKLTGVLEYTTPETLRNEISKTIKQNKFKKVLDLGCGTGLFGIEMRDNCQYLAGIDLSKNMLSIAKQKNIYDELEHSEISEYLSKSALCFDLICAADVFVYMGDLKETLQLLKSRNGTSFSLAFTTEHSEIGAFTLQSSGRYTHSLNYIRDISSALGYEIISHSVHPIRKESGTHIYGGFYILSSEDNQKIYTL